MMDMFTKKEEKKKRKRSIVVETFEHVCTCKYKLTFIVEVLLCAVRVFVHMFWLNTMFLHQVLQQLSKASTSNSFFSSVCFFIIIIIISNLLYVLIFSNVSYKLCMGFIFFSFFVLWRLTHWLHLYFFHDSCSGYYSKISAKRKLQRNSVWS